MMRKRRADGNMWHTRNLPRRGDGGNSYKVETSSKKIIWTTMVKWTRKWQSEIQFKSKTKLEEIYLLLWLHFRRRRSGCCLWLRLRNCIRFFFLSNCLRFFAFSCSFNSCNCRRSLSLYKTWKAAGSSWMRACTRLAAAWKAIPCFFLWCLHWILNAPNTLK